MIRLKFKKISIEKFIIIHISLRIKIRGVEKKKLRLYFFFCSIFFYVMIIMNKYTVSNFSFLFIYVSIDTILRTIYV